LSNQLDIDGKNLLTDLKFDAGTRSVHNTSSCSSSSSM